MTDTGGGSGYLTPIMSRRAEGEQISSELERKRSVAVERKVRRRGIGNGYFFFKGNRIDLDNLHKNCEGVEIKEEK